MNAKSADSHHNLRSQSRTDPIDESSQSYRCEAVTMLTASLPLHRVPCPGTSTRFILVVFVPVILPFRTRSHCNNQHSRPLQCAMLNLICGLRDSRFWISILHRRSFRHEDNWGARTKLSLSET